MPEGVRVIWYWTAELHRACNDASVTGMGITTWLVETGRAKERAQSPTIGIYAGPGETVDDVINRTVTEWRLAGCPWLWW